MAYLVKVVLQGPALGLLGSFLGSGLLQGLSLGPLLLPGLHALPPALCFIIQRSLLLFLQAAQQHISYLLCYGEISESRLWLASLTMHLPPERQKTDDAVLVTA